MYLTNFGSFLANKTMYHNLQEDEEVARKERIQKTMAIAIIILSLLFLLMRTKKKEQ
jgi:hypothetical protein